MDPRQLDSVRQKAHSVRDQYYRLLIAVTPGQRVDEDYGRRMVMQSDLPRINVSLELGRQLLGLKTRVRAIKTWPLLAETVEGVGHDTVWLDNIELLFEPSLHQDPLRVLQELSKRVTIIAVWRGAVEDGYLTYAEPGHPEYRRYSTRDLAIIHLDHAT